VKWRLWDTEAHWNNICEQSAYHFLSVVCSNMSISHGYMIYSYTCMWNCIFQFPFNIMLRWCGFSKITIQSSSIYHKSIASHRQKCPFSECKMEKYANTFWTKEQCKWKVAKLHKWSELSNQQTINSTVYELCTCDVSNVLYDWHTCSIMLAAVSSWYPMNTSPTRGWLHTNMKYQLIAATVSTLQTLMSGFFLKPSADSFYGNVSNNKAHTSITIFTYINTKK